MDKINDRRQWIVDELNCFNATPSWIGSQKQGTQCVHVINTGRLNTTVINSKLEGGALFLHSRFGDGCIALIRIERRSQDSIEISEDP